MAEKPTVGRKYSSASRGKPKKNQFPFGVILIVIMVAIGISLGTKNPTLALFWGTGICFGAILQKGRFCFTASMRDPFLTGSTSVTRNVLIAFAITTLGFAAIMYTHVTQGLPMPGMSYIVPASFATLIGAFMFGVGMVIAGGCTSGTLMRVGEGFHMQFISLFFFVIGSLWGAHDFGWWHNHVISKGKALFLPDLLGWVGAVALQLLILTLLYIAAKKYEQKRRGV